MWGRACSPWVLGYRSARRENGAQTAPAFGICCHDNPILDHGSRISDPDLVLQFAVGLCGAILLDILLCQFWTKCDHLHHPRYPPAFSFWGFPRHAFRASEACLDTCLCASQASLYTCLCAPQTTLGTCHCVSQALLHTCLCASQASLDTCLCASRASLDTCRGILPITCLCKFCDPECTGLLN